MATDNNETIEDIGRRIAAQLEAPPLHRPVVPLRPQHEEPPAPPEEPADDQRAAERVVEHNRLVVEALVTRAWQERIRQVRGDVQPDIGPRDIHVKAMIIRTLMSITEGSSGFALGEFERLI
jgi:hypothetical protein